MSVKIKEKVEGCIEYKDYYICGAPVAYCPNPYKKGYMDLVTIIGLLDGSDSNVGNLILRSQDGGVTWHIQGIIDKAYVYNNSYVKSGYGAVYADDKAGVLIYFANDTYWENNQLHSIWRKRRLYYRISFDNGYTWTDKRYVIQKGVDEKGYAYDKDHFLRGVTFGINSAASVAPAIIRADDDTLIVGVQIQVVDEHGNLINPTDMGFMKSGVIKGRWNPALLDYEWEVGEYVSVSLDQSTRGVYEPAVARAGNNKLIMVMRGSNAGRREEIPGVKFYSISEDNGLTWSKPSPLFYDDGSIMYSSSCMPRLIRHSNGRIYFIGVINEENPDGNLPRYPLCIAEIDTEKYAIKKDTVAVIDTKRKYQEENRAIMRVVDFSNHGVYEDKKTHDIVILAPFRKDMSLYRSVLNKYVVEV